MAFMSAALPYLQTAGAAMSAVSAFQQSKGAKDAYGIQSQIAGNNATIAGWQAQDALARGEREASRVRMRGNQMKGRQRAALAASGVDLGTGSALEILTDTDFFTDVDASTIKDNAAREAWAIRNQAANFNYESELLGLRSDRENPWMAAGTSLLTSAGKVAGSWYSSAPAARKTVPIYENPEY
jgi:hypothetical protein